MIDKSENFYEFDRNYPALKYFKKEEFESPDLEGSGEYMCPDFLQKLDMAREKAKIPFRINSGYRTPEHNEKVGGFLIPLIKKFLVKHQIFRQEQAKKDSLF